MPQSSMPGDGAYQLVHDKPCWMDNSRLNAATFVTTGWMLCPPGDDRDDG